jgi:ABC-type transport system involved in cytochrome bd biosynthesis fused ATPase/permease subunit
VLDTIAALVPAMTVLVIAHRRTTLDMAQHVVRIESGGSAGPALGGGATIKQ